MRNSSYDFVAVFGAAFQHFLI